MPFTALLANADAATFNLLRRGWFIPSDNIEGIAADYSTDHLRASRRRKREMTRDFLWSG